MRMIGVCLPQGAASAGAILLAGFLAIFGGLSWLEAEDGKIIRDDKGNIIQRAKPPKEPELQKAEKLLEEVFGRQMRAVKTPQQKSQLAQEILRAAREEEDPARCFAALQTARRLAIEALDGKLGLQIVQELVAAFDPPEEMSKEDRLAEAKRLYTEAQDAPQRTKIAKLLSAAEHYLRVGEVAGLDRLRAERCFQALGATLPQKHIVSLCQLKPLHAEAWNNQFAVNQSPVVVWPVIRENWKFCPEYLFAHAPSRLVFDIPPGSKRFSTIGYCAASGGHVAFRVLADNQLLAETSKAIVAPIQVDLPPSAKELQLVIDDLGDKTSDHSYWLRPQFHLEAGKTVSLIAVPPKTFSVWGVNRLYTNVDLLSDIVPPVEVEKEDRCREFLFAHAPSRLVYLLPPGAKAFSAIGYCLNKGSVKFKVAADGRILYESPPAGIISIRTEIPQGAKQLELVVDDLGKNWFDKSFWCYPRLELRH